MLFHVYLGVQKGLPFPPIISYVLFYNCIVDEASRELLVMYQNELALKETIVHNMAHTSDRDLSMTMVAAWIHEPYIKERADLILESLVQETGLR